MKKILVISVIFLISDVVSADCPGGSRISPCGCYVGHLGPVLSCRDSIKTDLKAILAKLGDFHFYQIRLASAGINQLPALAFGNVTVDEVYLGDNKNLSRIHRHAFSGPVAESIKKFVSEVAQFKLTNYPPEFDLFEALTKLINVETINLISGNITEIPDNAFGKADGSKLVKLTKLRIGGNRYKAVARVGSKPFARLTNLETLDLSYQRISRLPKDAFAFDSQNNRRILKIVLSGNLLNATSFPVGVFENVKSKFVLSLDNNKISYLPEVVFKPVFDQTIDKQYKLSLTNNQLDCRNCNWKWIVEKNIVQKELRTFKHLKCIGTRSVVNLTTSDFKHCK